MKKIKLGNVAKMPGLSWGISARKCITGAKLAKVKGTICASCYALNGNYNYPGVKASHESRLAEYNADRAQWVERMAFTLAKESLKSGEYRFRWFDSGDLQSVEMLEDIAEIARKTPKVRHWVPTKEYGIVKAYLAKHKLPANLTVRLSAYRVNQKAPELYGLPGSGVAGEQSYIYDETTDTVSKFNGNCHAYSNPDGKVNCGDCSMCWDKEVKAVYYPLH